MDLYVDGDGAGSASDRKTVDDLLRRLQAIVEKYLQDNDNAYYETLAWLCTRLARFKNLSNETRRTCFAALLPQQARRTPLPPRLKEAQLQLYQLLCECWPAEVAAILKGMPQIFRDFFAGDDTRMVHWFQHFSMDGLRHFKYGGLALATYALEHRDTAWRHLVWKGTHGQAPVSVAAKPFYFCKLEVVPTVRNLLEACPEFWDSEQLLSSFTSGEFLALSYPFFCEALQQLADGWEAGGGGRESALVARTVVRFVEEEDVQVLFSRLLSLLPGEQVLGVVRAVGADPRVQRELACPPKDTAALQDLGLVVFQKAAWASLSLCVLCHALACERGALLRLLQDDEEEGDVLRQLQEAARQLHRSAHLGAVHRALLCGARGLGGSRERLVVALEVWSLRTALLQEVERDPLHLGSTLARYGFKQLQGGSAEATGQGPSGSTGVGTSGRDGGGGGSGNDRDAGGAQAYELLASDTSSSDAEGARGGAERHKSSKRRKRYRKRRRPGDSGDSADDGRDDGAEGGLQGGHIVSDREGGSGSSGSDEKESAGKVGDSKRGLSNGRGRKERSKRHHREKKRKKHGKRRHQLDWMDKLAAEPGVREGLVSAGQVVNGQAAVGGGRIWHVEVGHLRVVGSSADVVDVLCCFACRRWLRP